MKLNRDERHTELRRYAIELGASVLHLEESIGTWHEEELIERIINGERSNREEKLSLLAFLSAIAAIVSALAAWIAVLSK